METKIIGIILLICAALIFQYSYEDFMDAFYSPSIKLKTTIEKDIKKSLGVEASNDHSKEPKNIHHVKFSYRSKEAYEFLKKHPPQFQTSDKGTIWLEVEVLDLQDENTPGFITQTSVFDIKSKNKISEFGETYYMKDFANTKKVVEPAKPESTEVKEKTPEEKPPLVTNEKGEPQKPSTTSENKQAVEATK